MENTLNQNQLKAVSEISKWFNNGNYEKRWFFLTGSAGTGKTYLISKLHEYLDIDQDDIVYVTYTGKASLVLNSKGIPARTIHQYFYHLESIDPLTREFKFKKRTFLPEELRLVIIDEVSMVSDDILQDILSFNIPILCVGDLNQLQPVKAENTMITTPDMNLTEVVRQAKDSPITLLALDVLNNTFNPKKNYGKGVYITSMDSIPVKVLCKATQVLCGTHKTRIRLNNIMREHLGFTTELPTAGDKIICCENNWEIYFNDIPLVNGLITTVDSSYDDGLSPDLMEVKITFNEEQVSLTVPKDPFRNIEYLKTNYDTKMEYGYAITCHKAQGSEFDNVAVICDWYNKKDRRNWLYTAITRAKKGILLGI